MIFYHCSYFIASLGFISAEISSNIAQKGLILIDFHLNLAIFFRKEILISFHFIRFAQIEALENRKGYAKIFKMMIFMENLSIFHDLSSRLAQFSLNFARYR